MPVVAAGSCVKGWLFPVGFGLLGAPYQVRLVTAAGQHIWGHQVMAVGLGALHQGGRASGLGALGESPCIMRADLCLQVLSFKAVGAGNSMSRWLVLGAMHQGGECRLFYIKGAVARHFTSWP